MPRFFLPLFLPLTLSASVLTYATYAGGSGAETGSAIAVDKAGNAYLAGSSDTGGIHGFLEKLDANAASIVASLTLRAATIDAIAIDSSSNVIVAGSIAGTGFPAPTIGAYQQANATGFVAKYTQDLKLVFLSTFAATPAALALDTSGAIYLTGTAGLNLPVTAGAVQARNAGGTCVDPAIGSIPCPDAFALKLSSDGARVVYATYLGGSDEDAGRAIAVNASGEVYIAGDTASFDFPTTPGAVQRTFGGRVIGNEAIYGDAFVAKLDASGANLVFSTYFGGTAPDIAWGIAVDGTGSAFVTGGTQSSDFPTTAGVYQPKYAGGTPLSSGADPAGDAFIAKFTSTGALAWSTFLGGRSRDVGVGIALDAAGNVYAAGSSESSDFPWTTGAVRGCRSGGPWVAQLDPAGAKLLRTSSIGGLGLDQAIALALDGKGGVYLAGIAESRAFLATGSAPQKTYGGGDSDAFAAKLDWTSDGRLFVACALNAASFGAGNTAPFADGAVAPGEVISLFGIGLGPDQPVVAQPAAGAPYPTTLGGTQIFFDGIPSPMWYTGPNQINAVVPYGIKASSTQMTVQRGGASDGPRVLPVAAAVPGIFTATGGQGQAAVLNEDGSYNTVANPAARGGVIVFYAVGAGAMSPPQRDGAVQPTSLPLPAPAAPVGVTVRGADARVLYAGAAPGYIAGLLQVNIQVPNDISFGNSVPLTLTIGGQASQVNVTIALK